MNGAEAVMDALHRHGTDVVFGYPGGAVLPLYDALAGQDLIRHVLVRHEAAAAHAAEGYARSTGRTGVFLVTSGPGATNVVTGLADAMMDGIPLVCITGQVPTTSMGTDAFQEADVVGITRPVTKHNMLVLRVEDLPKALDDAFRIAAEGRPGPVLVDIPKDVQLAKSPAYVAAPVISARPTATTYASLEAAIDAAYNRLLHAQRPVIYAGGGMLAGEVACTLLRRIAEALDIPVATTLLGLGCFPRSHALSLGMLGMHGTLEANMAMHGCDLMLALGARFDDRVTGRLDAFSPHSFKIHVDIARWNINKVVPADLGVVCTVEDFLSGLVKRIAMDGSHPRHPGWLKMVEGWRERARVYEDGAASPAPGILPQYAIHLLGRMLHERSRREGRPFIVSTDVGQHQMWAAQSMPVQAPRHWLTSGGLGTMGYGLPAAVGAQIAHPGALVACVSGDASVQMNIQELATVRENDLPVKLFVVNNGCMGMVRQWQARHHGGRYSQSVPRFMPDLVALAAAYSMPGFRVRDASRLEETFDQALGSPHPCVVDVVVRSDEDCYPMIPSGAAHNEVVLGAR